MDFLKALAMKYLTNSGFLTMISTTAAHLICKKLGLTDAESSLTDVLVGFLTWLVTHIFHTNVVKPSIDTPKL